MTLPESWWLFHISWAGLWGCFCFAQFLTLPFLQAGSKRSPVRDGNQVRGVKDGGVSENPLDFSSWPEPTADSHSSRSVGSPSSINIPVACVPLPLHGWTRRLRGSWRQERRRGQGTFACLSSEGNVSLEYLCFSTANNITTYLHLSPLLLHDRTTSLPPRSSREH